MSQLINIADDVYQSLTKLKKTQDASYSELIRKLLEQKKAEKTIGWAEIIVRVKERDAKFKGKQEKIDHDLIAYGVSRDRS